jgi:fluoride ion exporter CrcB/FEX
VAPLTPPLLAYLLAMPGSAMGGGARLYVATLVSRGLGTRFHWGTLAVNLLAVWLGFAAVSAALR